MEGGIYICRVRERERDWFFYFFYFFSVGFNSGGWWSISKGKKKEERQRERERKRGGSTGFDWNTVGGKHSWAPTMFSHCPNPGPTYSLPQLDYKEKKIDGPDGTIWAVRFRWGYTSDIYRSRRGRHSKKIKKPSVSAFFVCCVGVTCEW